jgi:hypothetical protein
VQPAIVALDATEKSAVRTIVVRNEGTTPLQFRVYPGDFDQEVAGDAIFLDYGASPHSCSGRLRLFPDGMVIGPGERQDVRVEMDGAAAACWSMVFVETLVPGAGRVAVSQRVGVKIHSTPPTASLEGKVAGVYTVTGAGKALQVLIEFMNTGEAPLRPKGDLEIRTPDGKIVTKVEVEPFSALPGHTRRILVPVGDKLAPGDYLAVPIIDFGGAYLTGDQIAFRVK